MSNSVTKVNARVAESCELRLDEKEAVFQEKDGPNAGLRPWSHTIPPAKILHDGDQIKLVSYIQA